MMLNDDELREVYYAVIKPFGHPDPIGVVTRALLLSDGDPDFVDGPLVGFVPVVPEPIMAATGVPEVYSLQNNLIGVMSYDRLQFSQYGSVEDMILATHFPESLIDPMNRTPEQIAFLDQINQSRKDAKDIVEPPLATVSDVVQLLTEASDGAKLTDEQRTFFKLLING